MRFEKKCLFAAGALLLSCQVAALPALQLDILGGTYVGGSEESTITTDPQFTLRALLKDTTSDATYRVSVALLPHLDSEPATPPDFGSFVADGVTYDIDDMLWGTPPADFGVVDPNAGLAPHGVFDAYFLELDAAFDSSRVVSAYNTEDASDQPNLDLMYTDFVFDVSELGAGYQLHFDFYQYTFDSADTKKKTKTVIRKAPFSHDAATDVTVPEPGIIALLGVGLVGIGAARGRRLS